MISPSCCARISGNATVTHCAAAARLPSIISLAFSGVSLSQCRSLILTPALLTRISRRPILSLIAAPTRLTASGSIKSPGSTCVVPPSARMRLATVSSGSRRLPVSTTAPPAFASVRCQCQGGGFANAAAGTGHPDDFIQQGLHSPTPPQPIDNPTASRLVDESLSPLSVLAPPKANPPARVPSSHAAKKQAGDRPSTKTR